MVNLLFAVIELFSLALTVEILVDVGFFGGVSNFDSKFLDGRCHRLAIVGIRKLECMRTSQR